MCYSCNMPRIVLISDTHSLHDEMAPIPDGDILIHAGDLTRNGTFAELTSVNAFFRTLPHQHKVCIAGNHDFCFEQDRDRAKALLPEVTYLQDKAVSLMGLRIYGSPWQPRFCDWAFNLDRGAPLRDIWARVPRNTDILVTHGPPCGIADLTDGDRRNVGCQDLLAAVQLVKPKLHVFGHIHYSYGIVEQNDTTFVNAAVCDEEFRPLNPPIVVDI